VSDGKFNGELAEKLLCYDPVQYLNCRGTRCLTDNLNNLRAQIAAHRKGINLINTFIEEYGEDAILFYMKKAFKITQKSGPDIF
jgi:5-oxoprolinase (ATP-hydrolysing)